MSAVYENKTQILDFFICNKLSPLPHLHKELELIHIKKGSCLAFADRKVYELHEGDIFLTFPYQIHYYTNTVHGDYTVHAFPASILISMEKTINQNELLNNVFHIEPGSFEETLFENIRATNGQYKTAERCAYITLILSKLLPQCELSPLHKGSSETVKRIMEYCSKHYTQNLSLDILASELHLNKYYISHIINKQINMRLNTIINSLRIDAACSMLKDKNLKIGEIAQAVGYETIRSFNRAFVDITGTTPKEYRAALS